MGILSTIILILCVIVCVIIVLLVLVQNEDEMGGFMGGASSSTFGARSATAFAKITRVAVFIFFVLVFSLALLNRSRNTGFQEELKKQQQDQSTEWWKTEKESKADTEASDKTADNAETREKTEAAGETKTGTNE